MWDGLELYGQDSCAFSLNSVTSVDCQCGQWLWIHTSILTEDALAEQWNIFCDTKGPRDEDRTQTCKLVTSPQADQRCQTFCSTRNVFVQCTVQAKSIT
eukprot:3506261-Amphidinium_carterae.1